MKNGIYIVTINFHLDSEIKRLQKDLKSEVEKITIINNSNNNRGFAKGVNIGIRQALKENASKVLLINPDIDISKNNLKNLLSGLYDISSPVLKFKRQGKEINDYGGQVNFIFGRPTHFENIKPEKIDFVSGACMLIKTEVFKKIGLFDEDYFMYFEDVDFCLRAKDAGFTIGVDPNSIAYHQISEHKFKPNVKKQEYIIDSNEVFIKKWVSLLFKPMAYLYLFWLKLKFLTQKH